MDSTRWNQVQELFEAALDRPQSERADFVRTRASDDEIAGEVLSLLEADGRPLGALDTPIVEMTPGELEWTPELEPGARVGPWRIEETLGAGGMGVVYRAVRVEGGFEQEVAIKRVRRGMDSRRILRRFEAERAILAGLQHENIARLLDGGLAEDGLPYFVVEYVRGRPIDVYCDEEKLTVDERLDLFVAVCRAVLHAHANLVVHRDLKPANILVTDDGVPKLLDFGIARLMDDEGADAERTRLTQVGERVLTPDYASPEQFRGESIGTASDIYSLGVILYELLVGDRPSPPDRASESITVTRPSTAPSLASDPERARMVGAARRLSPERLRKRVSGDLDLICLKALRDEPDRRYASVDAFADDLERHRGGFPVRARPDTLGYRISRFVRRNRAAVVSSAAGLGVLLASSAYYTTQVASERDRAQLEAERAEQVADFLAGILATEEGETSARDLLDAGAARLEVELADQPLVLARLREVIGRAYQSLGESTEALEQFRLAVEEMTPLPADASDEERIELTDAQSRLAMGLVDIGRSEEAAEIYRDVLVERREVMGVHTKVADAHYQLGLLYVEMDELDAAVEEIESALEILYERERQGVDIREPIRVTLADLSAVHLRRDDAEAAYAAALASDSIAAIVYGDVHASRLESQMDLAWSSRMLGDEDAYEEHLDAAAVLSRTLHPEGSVERIRALSGIANARSGAAQRVQATELFVEVADQAKEFLGPDSRWVDDSYRGIGELLIRLRRYEEAISWLEQAQAAVEAREGRIHNLYARGSAYIAQAYQRMGEPELAIPPLRDAVEIRRELRHAALYNALENLGAAYLEAGRHGEALTALQESRDLTPERRTLDLARVEGRIGTVYEQMGEMETAIPILTRSLEALEAELPQDHPVPSSVRRALERARAGEG